MSIQQQVNQLIEKYETLKKKKEMLTLDEVDHLVKEQLAFEKELQEKKHMHRFSLFFQVTMYRAQKKIAALKSCIDALTNFAKENENDAKISKILWKVQKRGFLSSDSFESIVQTYKKRASYTKSIRSKAVFLFRVVSRKEGLLELIIFEKDDPKVMTVVIDSEKETICVDGTKTFSSFDEIIDTFCKEAISLQQLDDIAIWLDGHGIDGTVHCELLSDVVEEKLSKMLYFCPNGAYILYPEKKGGLRLSRLLRQGDLKHLAIDLFTKPGAYTMKTGKTTVSLSRQEFKKTLEEMGKAVTIRR